MGYQLLKMVIWLPAGLLNLLMVLPLWVSLRRTGVGSVWSFRYARALSYLVNWTIENNLDMDRSRVSKHEEIKHKVMNHMVKKFPQSYWTKEHREHVLGMLVAASTGKSIAEYMDAINQVKA